MKEYIIPFAAYLLARPVFGLVLGPQESYLIHAIIGTALIIVFWKRYRLSFKPDALSFAAGLLIAGLWLLLGGIEFSPGSVSFDPQNSLMLFGKLLGFVAVAPVIEELFIRRFLLRFLIGQDWRMVIEGSFSWFSFIATVLFFGFSHNAWAAGLVTGIILNGLLYLKKRIEPCIIAHLTANLALAAYIIATGSWGLW